MEMRLRSSGNTIKDSVLLLVKEIQKSFKQPLMSGAVLSLLKTPSFFISGRKATITQLEKTGFGTTVFKVGTSDYSVVFNIEADIRFNSKDMWSVDATVIANFKPDDYMEYYR